MLQVNSDGGARGNPGKAAIGVVIRKEDRVLEEYKEKIGSATNNIAEYKALLKAMELSLKYEKEATFTLDSELVVKQLLGEYQVKQPHLKLYWQKVRKIEEKFDKVFYKHKMRWDKFQKMADKLVNEALDE